MRKFAAVVIALVLTGCHGKKKCSNCFYGQGSVAHFSKKDCKDLPAGQFECNHVVFDPQKIDANAGKK